MKRTIYSLAFFFFVLLSSLPLRSQSLFEIKFTDRQKIQYSCLLVFFHENNAYMRIAYTYNNVYNVVNVSYDMKNGINRQGKKYAMLTGHKPMFITDNKANLKYNPDYFIWFYNDVARTWDIPYTTDDSLLNPANYVVVDVYKRLDPQMITDQYLRSFFNSYEAQYFSLKKMCGLTPVTVTPVKKDKSATLHFVLIANTLDARIGMGCSADEMNLKHEFALIAGALGVSFRQYIVDGDAFSKARVVSTLNSLLPGENDIVVFIYRGHGFRWKNQSGDWPRMDLRFSPYDTISERNSMNLSEIYSSLKSKGARLNIILGDCCNSEINMSPVTNTNYLTFQIDNNSDLSKLRRLFLGSKGIILSAAARKGEVSWNTSQGGLYSMSFLQALREEVSYLNAAVSSWDNIVSKTINLARTKSTPTFCGGCSLQNGIKYLSVTAY